MAARLNRASERDLKALRNLIDETQLVSSTVDLGALLALSNFSAPRSAPAGDLLAAPSSAASFGQRGGKKTAERGSDYFKKIAATRKDKSGGLKK